MTANDLATQLIRLNGYGDLGPNVLDVTQEAATMLRQQQDKLTKYELRHAEQRKRIEELETLVRQQQAEIEALKKHNGELIWALAQQSNVLGENKSDELSDWADAEEEAQRDNEQFFKDLKAGKILLKPEEKK